MDKSGLSDYERIKMVKDLKKTLDKACEAYYNSGSLIMTDEEFDSACITYRKLSGKSYNTKTKPKKKDTSGKRLVNVEHTFKNLTGTIDYKFPKLDDVRDWLESVYNQLGLKSKTSIDILCSMKYDGNSAEGEFKDGKAVTFLTRGDDGNGADLTKIFKDEKINDKRHLGVRYEVMMTYEQFDKLNEIQEKNGEKTYANPRSTVAGLLSKSDAYKFRDYLTLVPLSVQIDEKEEEQLNDRFDELDFIEEKVILGDIEFNGEVYSGNIDELMSQIEELYYRYHNSREKLNYMIDGVVIELVDNDYKDKLGRFANGSPKWSCALKFPYMEKHSKVVDIVFEASPNGSGKITPSAIYEPVYFIGAKQTKTSLANYKRFKQLKLGKGSDIVVQYRNEVLSYVDVLDTENNKNIEPIPFTDKCPACGGKTRIITNDKDEETFVYCINKNCIMKKIGKINKYTTDVGIKGIEVTTIKKIVEAGLLNSVADLYRLKYRDLVNIEGFGQATAENIIEAIYDNRPKDYNLLSGLGIANLGRDLSKTLLSEMPFDLLSDKEYVESDEFKERISKLDGIGDIMTERISQGLSENNELLNDILQNAKFESTKREKVENQLKFCTTGDPDHKFFKDRAALKEYIESKGHKLTSAVSGKTDYLITETPNSGTVKNRKAKELGVKIITCADLKDLLG